jgi:hypothetical protein
MIMLALTTLAATAVADDSAKKKPLVGRWKIGDDTIILESDGTMYSADLFP